MLLRCISARLTSSQADALAGVVRPNEDFHLEVGAEYVALGLEFWRGAVWADIWENDRTVISAPLSLFEIVDGQLSARWIARTSEEGAFRLWPELFYERAFHDRLSNGEPMLVDRFVALRREMEAEAR
jgi:hypothetical protein